MATDRQNRQNATELAQQMIRRAELAVDFAFITLGDVAERAAHSGVTGGVTGSVSACNPAVQSSLREQVFRHATIKDIRILDGSGKILCSAFPETVTSISFRVDLTRGETGRNSEVRLLRLPGLKDSNLGIVWTLEQGRSLMAIVNTSALLFDILPAALRDSSEAAIRLSGSKAATSGKATIATYRPASWNTDGRTLTSFSAGSSRYPLRALIQIDSKVLAAWHRDTATWLLMLAGMLGLVFGFLIIKTLFREPHPVAAIDRALAAKEFEPFFQPVFDLKTGQITSCEMLARWVKADGSIVPPYEFIPLAEQTGRIVPMTWQMVDKALAQFRPYLRRNKTFRIAVNFGVSHLLQPAFIDELRQHVTGARVGSRNIVIELTEREELLDFDRAAQLIAELQGRGYFVALDDAGTGHSGLSYVQKLGADVIKIDKFFVDSVVTTRSARVLIEMLVNLARELGMTTIAEGIETPEQADALLALGVDKGQGYLVSPAVPAAKFFALLDLQEMSAGISQTRAA